MSKYKYLADYTPLSEVHLELEIRLYQHTYILVLTLVLEL